MVLFTSVCALATQDSEQLPDMALLEYLAELVEVDGELVGPMDMADDPVKKTMKVKSDQDEQTSGQKTVPLSIDKTKASDNPNSTKQEDKDHD